MKPLDDLIVSCPNRHGGKRRKSVNEVWNKQTNNSLSRSHVMKNKTTGDEGKFLEEKAANDNWQQQTTPTMAAAVPMKTKSELSHAVP